MDDLDSKCTRSASDRYYINCLLLIMLQFLCTSSRPLLLSLLVRAKCSTVDGNNKAIEDGEDVNEESNAGRGIDVVGDRFHGPKWLV
jgi:hypothetical protein